MRSKRFLNEQLLFPLSSGGNFLHGELQIKTSLSAPLTPYVPHFFVLNIRFMANEEKNQNDVHELKRLLSFFTCLAPVFTFS